MKRFGILIGLFLLFSIGGMPAQAQTISPIVNHTASEEVEGKAVWEKLQAKQLECKNLTDDNYASLGEYFMGQLVGSSHEAMNTMMENMMGKAGEEQMHIVMGRWGGFGVLGWLTIILFWILLLLGVIALVRYLGSSGKRRGEDKSSLDILKDRYARGEIGKKEFEEMKKDLR